MNLGLFDNRRNDNNGLTNKFIEELKNSLKKMENEEKNLNEADNVLEEYNLYEKRKIYLDNKTRFGNALAWVMDENSVCISENGDGGPISIKNIDLPEKAKSGEVYEKIDGKYIYNEEITEEINSIVK
ncbi:MAG: hypothetical protein J6M60_06575 [Clostridia bacterium]|nr:hypothetical protein [Clostridia bacterium]